MYAQDNGLILRRECQILLQPLILLLEECTTQTCSAVVIAIVEDVAHAYNMHITTIEREVYRAVDLLVVALSLQLDIRACSIGV